MLYRQQPFLAGMVDHPDYQSVAEKDGIEAIVGQNEKEYLLAIDNFSQDELIAPKDLLLIKGNRHDNRQLIRGPLMQVIY
ncbi:hypothetical protein [Spirosoma jeollabukense]